MMGMLGWGKTPEYYAEVDAARKKWMRHYVALGCNLRKAEELTSRKVRKAFP